MVFYVIITAETGALYNLLTEGVFSVKYYAHKSEDGRSQTVKEHLYSVAELAESFSIELFKEIAYAAGLLHDIGKYSKRFQKRLEGEDVRYEHSCCGAIECCNLSGYRNPVALMLEYCILGHHTGIPDGGTEIDNAYNDVTLHSRLKRGDYYKGESEYSSYRNEISPSIPDEKAITNELLESMKSEELIEKFAFFTRYVFSCLTDADFLDTEKFCNPMSERGLQADFSEVKRAVENNFKNYVHDTPLKEARGRLQNQAYKNSKTSGDISILNMPTGSGKTLCSLNIALSKLTAPGSTKKRIIYVIPYTSVIEQTADTFENIFGKYADILQHHSNYVFDDDTDEDPDTAMKLKKATENWDAPFIITTNVQFFESLYHYKGSGLRKLHNVGDSVIIFDEIHLLPINMLQPCLRGIGYITKYLNSEAIFLSATMPDFDKLFKRYLPDCTVTNLMTDMKDFKYFKKCRYINLGKTDYEGVLEKSDQYSSSLIVVNKKKTAQELYKSISGKKYHLSTYMTPNDRSRIIKTIREELEHPEKITVVSTSLIEVGVDLNFKSVFREMAGLDNIIQTGGRCNRDGKDKIGDVFIFELDEKPNRDMQNPIDIVKDLINKYDDISSVECIEEYYRRLYDFNKESIAKNSISSNVSGIDNIPFRTYSMNFEFIKEETIGIVINNCKESEELVQRLKDKDYTAKRGLQRYTVSLRRYEFEQAFKLGIIDDFGTGVFMLTNNEYYSDETGLNTEMYNDIVLS